MSNLIATRQAFGEALYELMHADPRVVTLTADLGESLRLLKIRDEMLERFIDTGVAEANMAGIAAGLAIAGHVPIAGTFAVFLTRAFDHIRVQICQNNLHVIMVGSHGGVSNALDGASAHALEDIAYMRTLPNMTIIYPADANEMKQAVAAVARHDGPIYLRLYREPTPVVTDEAQPFEIGKIRVLREGTDVTIAATGPHVAYAVEAAELLAKEGINAEVLNVATIQPLDTATIVTSVQKTRCIVTAEDHSINGGLGSAIAEALAENHPVPLQRVGVRQFGESGKYSELIAKLGIDAAGIAATTRKLVSQLETKKVDGGTLTIWKK